MSRPLRIEYPGAFYHVMNRGADRIDVFHNPDFFQLFLDVIAEAHEKYELETHAFCLMNNHYHLLLCTPKPNLNKIMKYINGVFTQRCNILRNGDGPLFRGRYKSLLVDTDNYLLQGSRYIHLNPVDAGMVKKPEDYHWSSCKYYLKSIEKPKWLYCNKILDFFSKNNPTEDYHDFILQKEEMNLKDDLERKRISPILGSKYFMSDIKLKYISDSIRTEIPQLRMLLKNLSQDPENIIQIVSKYFNITPAEIKKYRRGYKNMARMLTIYLIKRFTKLNYQEISDQFENLSPSGISNIYKKIESILRK